MLAVFGLPPDGHPVETLKTRPWPVSVGILSFGQELLHDPVVILRCKQAGAAAKIRMTASTEQARLAFEQIDGHLTEVVFKGVDTDIWDWKVVVATML
jgi:hypothetical protein